MKALYSFLWACVGGILVLQPWPYGALLVLVGVLLGVVQERIDCGKYVDLDCE